jgi:hypothetical protein
MHKLKNQVATLWTRVRTRKDRQVLRKCGKHNIKRKAHHLKAIQVNTVIAAELNTFKLAEIKGAAFPIDLKSLEYTQVSNRRGDK